MILARPSHCADAGLPTTHKVRLKLQVDGPLADVLSGRVRADTWELGWRRSRALGANLGVVIVADTADFSALRGFASVHRAVLVVPSPARCPVVSGAVGAARTKPVASDDILVIDQ